MLRPDSIRHNERSFMKEYPLYDVPWLVQGSNDHYRSWRRHQIEVRNQAVVDDYFVARDKGVPAHEARRQVAETHGMSSERVYVIIKWFFNQARKRKKYDFLIKFSQEEEH